MPLDDWKIDETVVETLPDRMVRITFGPLASFDVPRIEAIKFAYLLLKKSGCEVEIDKSRMPPIGH